MADFTEIATQLARPFPTTAISWRVGATNAKSKQPGDDLRGIPLAYIDARDVMDRLDDVVGPENWQDRYSINGPKTICSIGVRCGDEWVWKEDGAGDTDYEAEKGALSDAFKRAAVRWGVGRYLYGLKSGWIEVEQRGQTFVIPKESRKELDKLHDIAISEIEWGDRSARNTYRLLIAALQRMDTNAIEDLEANNLAVIKTLPVAMQANLKQKIEHIGAASARKEAAE